MRRKYQPPAGVEDVAVKRLELGVVHRSPTDRLALLSDSVWRLHQVEVPGLDGDPVTESLAALVHGWESLGALGFDLGNGRSHGFRQRARLAAGLLEELVRDVNAV